MKEFKSPKLKTFARKHQNEVVQQQVTEDDSYSILSHAALAKFLHQQPTKTQVGSLNACSVRSKTSQGHNMGRSVQSASYLPSNRSSARQCDQKEKKKELMFLDGVVNNDSQRYKTKMVRLNSKRGRSTMSRLRGKKVDVSQTMLEKGGMGISKEYQTSCTSPKTLAQDMNQKQEQVSEPCNQRRLLTEQKVFQENNIGCSVNKCPVMVYKSSLCKNHFLESLRYKLRKDITRWFRDPETAFATFNFSGKTSITMKDLIGHRLIKVNGYDENDLKAYLLRDKVFKHKDDELDYMQFKKFFFPQLLLISDTAEGNLARQEDEILNEYMNYNTKNKSQGHTKTQKKKMDQLKKEMKEGGFVRARLAKLTDFLRDKFQNSWVSVRKAFLDLDFDKDGYISSEDIMKHFGDQGNQLFDYYDLVKVLHDIDSKKQGTLNYADFCSWMGGAIHKSEGFLFRHDSALNPPYQEILVQREEQAKKYKNECNMTVEDIETALARKIEFQWKTLQSAFNQLNLGKSGKIQKWELKYYCNHWGYNLSSEQFQQIFDRLDVDKDGQISYNDLQVSFGKILNPPENFYFRQDMKKKPLFNLCQIPHCNFKPVGFQTMCIMHTKQMKIEAMDFLNNLKMQIGSRWEQFVDEIHKKAKQAMFRDKTQLDDSSISLEILQKCLISYGISLTQSEKELIMNALSAKSESSEKNRITLKAFKQVHDYKSMTDTYNNFVYKMEDFTDQATADTAGYFGTNHHSKEAREKVKQPFSDFEQIRQLVKDKKTLLKIMNTIRSIDKERNGFVTNQELEDILQLHHKEELDNYDLKPALKQFASESNHLLINYFKFKEAIIGKNTSNIEFMTQSQKEKQGFLRAETIAAGVPSKKDCTAKEIFKGYEIYNNKVTQPIVSGEFEGFISQEEEDNMNKKENEVVPDLRMTSSLDFLNINKKRNKESTTKNFSVSSNRSKTQFQQTSFGILKPNLMEKIRNLKEIQVAKNLNSKQRFQDKQIQSDTVCLMNSHSRFYQHMPKTHSQLKINSSASNLINESSQSKKSTVVLNRKTGKNCFDIGRKSLDPSMLYNNNNNQRNLESKNHHHPNPNLEFQIKKQPLNNIHSPEAAQSFDNRKSQQFINSKELSNYKSSSHLRKTLNVFDTLKKQMKEKRSQSRCMSPEQEFLFRSSNINKTKTKFDQLSQKLKYEWKNIYRQLLSNQAFPKGQGWIKKSIFQRILTDNGVTLQRPEFNQLCQMFMSSEQLDCVNFIQMSKCLNLHSAQLDLIQANPFAQLNIPQKQLNSKTLYIDKSKANTENKHLFSGEVRAKSAKRISQLLSKTTNLNTSHNSNT